MKGKKLKVTIVGALVALGAIAVVATSALVKDDKVNPVEGAKTKPALSVTTTTLQEAQWARTLSANGNIVAWQEAIIGAEIGGFRLTDVLVNVGDVVKRGQVLARIATDTVDAELAQAKAAAAEAEAMKAEAIANANRSRQLRASGFISSQQVTQSVTTEEAASARLAAARARVKANEVRLTQMRLVAPDDGIISARNAAVGSIPQPGEELFRLIRQGRLEWRAEVTAAELARVKPAQIVRLVSASGEDVKGTVRMVAPTVNPQTRMGLVYVDLPPGSPVRAGTFARGEFELERVAAMTLPQSAVLLRDGFSYVFKLDGKDRVFQTKVTVGRRVGDRIEITEGLAPGIPVVASGAGFLADGDTVRVVDAPAAQAQSERR